MYDRIFAQSAIIKTTEEEDDEVFQDAPAIDDDEFYIPALRGEYFGLAGVTSDGTAVLDFSMHPPVSSLVRLNPNWVG